MENSDTNKTIDDKMKRAALRDLSKTANTIFTTTGRMRRKHAIPYFILFLILSCIASYIDIIQGLSYLLSEVLEDSIRGSLLGMGLGSFIIFLPLFPLAKRLHDINLSTWWIGIISIIFLLLLPSNFIALLVLIVPAIILCWPGTKGPNKYGEDPREENS